MGEQEKESKKLERSISCAISTFASSDMVSSILQSSQTLPVPRTFPSLTISPPIMQARPMKLPAGTTTFKNKKTTSNSDTTTTNSSYFQLVQRKLSFITL